MSGWYLKSVSSEKTWTNAKTEWGDLGTSYGQYIYDLSGSIQPGSSDLTWRKIDTATDPSLNPLSAYWFKVVEAASSGSGDSGSGSGPGWKKVFRQTASYLWTSGSSESSPLDNMKNNQLNTESDDNYSIMNEIFNSSTRDNYKYNGVYKFKMVNTQGYELTWTQTGNPFDHTNEVPGTVSDISAVNFTLASDDAYESFDGLHVTNAPDWTILEGATSGYSRYSIGEVQLDPPGNGKLNTISTANDNITYSDWVELYAYVSDSGSGDSGSGDSGSGDSGASGDSGSGSSTTTTYNFWDHGLTTGQWYNLDDATEPDSNPNLWAAQFPLISSLVINVWNYTDDNDTIPGVTNVHATQQALIDSNYPKAVALGAWPHNSSYGFIEFTFTETASCKLVYGSSAWNSTNGSQIGSTADKTIIVYKNGTQIDSTADIQKILTFDVANGDVIKLSEDKGSILLYALEVTTSGSGDSGSGDSGSGAGSSTPVWGLISDSIADWNGGFEDDVLSNNTFKKYGHDDSFGGVITGWTYTKGTHATWGPTLLHGSSSAYGNQGILHGNQVVGLRYEQTITKSLSGLTTGRKYKFTFEASNRNGFTETPYALWLDNDSANPVMSGNVSNGSDSTSEQRTISYEFTSTSANHTLTIKTLRAGDGMIWLDNVQLYEDTAGGSGDSGSGDSGSGSGVSEQQDLIVNNGNYTGLTETTIATGVPTNTEIEIVSYTLTNADSAAVSNIAFTKYQNQNNVFVLYGVLPSGRSVVLKITFSISSEGVLTIQHNGSVLAKGYDQLTSETASNSYDDPLVVYGPGNGGADYHYFTDLTIRY